MILLIIPFKYIAGSLIIEEGPIKEINMLIMFVYDYEDTTVEELMTQYEDKAPKERKPQIIGS